jgi:sulfite exporter TauE/SafE
MLTAILSGATLALLNVVHCAAMCGPLSSAVCLPAGGQRLVRYQLGRLSSYAFVGAMSGHFGRALRLVAPGAAGAWVVATLTAAACLLTARSLVGATASSTGLVQLKVGRTPRSLFALLVGLVPREPFVFGLLSALLPCGVLASAVLAAVAFGDAVRGMLLMLTFSAVSGVAVWSASVAIQFAPRRFALPVRRGLAAVLVVLAGLTLYRPMRALTREPLASEAHAACHESTP